MCFCVLVSLAVKVPDPGQLYV